MDKQALAAKHSLFTYDEYRITPTGSHIKLSVHYTLHPDIKFITRLSFPKPSAKSVDLNLLAFHWGLIEMFSYWKAACSPRIQIHAGHLDADQLAWWRQTLIDGMGEFFYTNRIDFTTADFLHLTAHGRPIHRPGFKTRPSTSLLGLGGGKDSALTAALLHQADKPFTPFIIGQVPKAYQLIKALGLPQPLLITRQLDPRLLQLNQAGYLNGHTPFSAAASFIALLVAAVHNTSQIIVSNELSANAPSLTYLGHPINHQYSKSITYESRFRQYVATYLTSDINYFSFLRPLNELQIGRLLAKFPQVLPHLVSCNRGGSTGIWCLDCHKCAFTFLLLSAFLDPQDVELIFHANMFTLKSTPSLFLDLVHPDTTKPLDCIGTKAESQCALLLAQDQYRRLHRPLPPMLQNLVQALPQPKPDCPSLLHQFNRHHYLPKTYAHLLRQALS